MSNPTRPDTYAVCPECGARFDTPDVDTRIEELEAEVIKAGASIDKAAMKRIEELERGIVNMVDQHEATVKLLRGLLAEVLEDNNCEDEVWERVTAALTEDTHE